MNYQLYWPSPPLRPYIQFYGLLSSKGPEEQAVNELVAPYLGKGLIFALNESADFWVTNQHFQRQAPPAYFMPQCTQSFRLDFKRKSRLLAVIFRPGKFRHFFRLPAQEMVDHQMVTYEDAGMSDLVNLHYQLLQAGTILRQLALIEQLLIRRAAGLRFQQEFTDAVLREISRKQFPSIKQLSERLNVSTRYLRRRFSEDIGIAPKTFIRIRRFNWAFQQLKSGQFNKLSDIAYSHHYFDQSHFIQDFKNFIGVSPTEFIKGDHFMQNNLYWRDEGGVSSDFGVLDF